MLLMPLSLIRTAGLPLIQWVQFRRSLTALRDIDRDRPPLDHHVRRTGTGLIHSPEGSGYLSFPELVCSTAIDDEILGGVRREL